MNRKWFWALYSGLLISVGLVAISVDPSYAVTALMGMLGLVASGWAWGRLVDNPPAANKDNP